MFLDLEVGDERDPSDDSGVWREAARMDFDRRVQRDLSPTPLWRRESDFASRHTRMVHDGEEVVVCRPSDHLHVPERHRSVLSLCLPKGHTRIRLT